MIYTYQVGNFSTNYDSETGKFISNSRRRNGHELGFTNDSGYTLISVSGVIYRAHRLAWLIVHGVNPPNDIDHINGIRTDNRLANLRIANRSENMQNIKRAHIDNKSGLLGVSCVKGKYWFARISVNGKREYLGSFATKEAAHSAYLARKIEIHDFSSL